MNKKGKNKKGKVPNPVPTQEEKSGDKIEDVGVIGETGDLEKTSDIVENVGETIESVKEERVPEIVSEVITAPVDTKDEETPKKPKRNRGKKKKGKEDDFDDNVDEGAMEFSVPPPEEEVKVESQEAEKEMLDVPIVTPTARKKKNKKKNADQKAEEPIPAEPEPTSLPVTVKDTIEKPEVIETPNKQETTAQSEIVEPEVKPSKKKNKKKKRNDSERSEREEISCTAAFQKLIDVSDESAEVKVQENVGEITTAMKDVKPVTEIPAVTDVVSPSAPVVETESVILTEESTKVKEAHQAPTAEGKSKKKNKKDKKHIPKSEEILPDEPITEPTLPVETDKPTDTTKDNVMVENIEPHLEETSPKPKAKIAKPVEKKRKGKQDNQATDSLSQDISVSDAAKVEQLLPPFVLEAPKTDVTAEKETSVGESKNVPEKIPADETNITTDVPSQFQELSVEEFEPLNIMDKAMGKKRKKGQKIPKTPDVSFEILESNIEMDVKQPVVEPTEPKTALEPIASDNATLKEEQACTTSEIPEMPIIDVPTDIKPPAEAHLKGEIKDHILLTPEFAEERDFTKIESVIPEKAEGEQKFETKSGKKRKKSPKPPKRDIKPEAEDLAPKIQKPTEESVPKPDVTKEMSEKIYASNITRMYDIEISSINADESEGSTCDTVPDITYPRASSQQLLDNNNNDTVIREIFPVSEITSNVPVAECIQAAKIDIKPKEHNVSPSKEEKTDIKSKMMEVNQDMEELRLSIERSLAELTSMEKSEELVESKFQESKMKTVKSKTQDVIQTKDIHEKMVEISDAEKSSIEKPSEKIESTEVTQDSTKIIVEQLFSMGTEQSAKETVSQADNKATKSKAKKKGEPKIAKEVTVAKEESKDAQPIADINIKPPTSMATEEKPVETMSTYDKAIPIESSTKQETVTELPIIPAPIILPEEKKIEQIETEKKEPEIKPTEETAQLDTPPVCPARKDNKNKHKKKKGKQDSQVTSQPTQSAHSSTTTQSTTQETKKEEKTDSKSEKKADTKESKEKGKQQASAANPVSEKDLFSDIDYEPIENFEDALTSSVDDVNKTFEMIVTESHEQTNPKINIIAPDEDKKTPVSPPKNLLGHPDIPVPSNRMDYKKEKNKIPNEITAKVKIKDAVDVEKKQSKNTQTINKLKDLKDCRMSDNEEFVYKYSFRKVFLQTVCHVCNKSLAGCRLACCYCNLVFYCGIKHKDEDWPQHQALCFAVSTIGHLKDQKHIYADAKNITGHDYRLIRMQMIVSCEKVLKRRLVPWEQEALLYPRICAHVPCREWRQMKLSDCQGCGQISYCTDHPEHLPKSHARWCKSYSLYQKLVCYQQTKGRLEPKLPTKVMQEHYEIPEKINEVLAGMYEEKIDIDDIQYAALTQLATAPLTAAYCHQICRNKTTTANGYKRTSFTIHVVGAELQFEADALNKWEVFFLHLRPDLQELRVVLINYNLNPSNLPLELLGKIKLCENCRQNKRRVLLNFQDKRTYSDYKSSEEFVVPDLVCAFNPSIQRSSVYNGKDPWPSAVNVILKQKVPFIITGYTITELHKDCIRIKECSETGYNFITEPKYNNFASVRPDRNFISDDEMPLLFKNYCFAIICG